MTCNQDALRYWALQYGPYVEIIEPVELRESLRDDVKKMFEKYSNTYAEV